ncbi:hypothetical protein AVEN_176888-1 [Araneus ventricosus]|uniref:Uncharacterized protein n=1 Tax=Araneus ventricosus TaxID=182803 RepID=A0A4Y2NDR9_ARAVE|nr:hypothetical protein AVEN_176888-1 [Araneus ventricosus]
MYSVSSLPPPSTTCKPSDWFLHQLQLPPSLWPKPQQQTHFCSSIVFPAWVRFVRFKDSDPRIRVWLRIRIRGFVPTPKKWIYSP